MLQLIHLAQSAHQAPHSLCIRVNPTPCTSLFSVDRFSTALASITGTAWPGEPGAVLPRYLTHPTTDGPELPQHRPRARSHHLALSVVVGFGIGRGQEPVAVLSEHSRGAVLQGDTRHHHNEYAPPQCPEVSFR